MSNNIRSFTVIFLFVTLITLYPSKITVSFGQASFYSDSPLMAETTDCISSLMTSAIVGSSEDCTDIVNKANPLANNIPDESVNDTSDIIKPDNDTSETSYKPDNDTSDPVSNAASERQ